MGSIVDKVLGKGGGTSKRPDGSTLGMTTPATWRGNTVMGPAGGYATHFATTRPNGQITGVSAITAKDYRAAPSGAKKSGGLLGGMKTQKSTTTRSGTNNTKMGPNTARDSSGNKTSKAATSGARVGVGRNVGAGPRTGRNGRMASGGIVEQENTTMKKRMNMGGLPSQANTMARNKAPGAMGAPGGMGAKARAMAQAPGRTGGIGQQMSALARVQRPAQTMKAGGRVKRANAGGMMGAASGGRMERMQGRMEDMKTRMADRTARMTSRMEGAPEERKARIAAKIEEMKAKFGSRMEKFGSRMEGVKSRMGSMMGGRENAAARRQAALDRFKSKRTDPKFADIISKRQGMIDAFKAKIPTKPAGMKAGGMVRGAGCATRGKKHSKKMG